MNELNSERQKSSLFPYLMRPNFKKPIKNNSKIIEWHKRNKQLFNEKFQEKVCKFFGSYKNNVIRGQSQRKVFLNDDFENIIKRKLEQRK